MATLNVFSGTNDGYVISQDGNEIYADARAGTGTSGLAADTSATGIIIGQRHNSSVGFIQVDEGFVSFDLSGLPGGATVTNAVLSLYGSSDFSSTDFTIEARESNWGATLTTADYVAGANLGALTRLATFATSGGFSTSAYNAFTNDGSNMLNRVIAAGTGTLYVLLCSDHTVSNTAPTPDVDERVVAYSADQTGTANDPKLVITYTVATAAEDPFPFMGGGYFDA